MDLFNKAKEAATAVAGVAKQKGEELMHATMDTAGKTKDSVINTVNVLRGQPSQDKTTLNEQGGPQVGATSIAGPTTLSSPNSGNFAGGVGVGGGMSATTTTTTSSYSTNTQPGSMPYGSQGGPGVNF